MNDSAKRVGDGLPEHVIRHCRDDAVRPKAQHNFTDPDSRIMEHQGGFVQAFNAQAIATEDQIIASQGLSNAAPDTYYLQPLVSGVQANCGELPTTLLADAGYWAPSNAGFLKDTSIDGYISVGRESHEVVESPSGVDPPATPRDEMRAKLQAPDGREQYRARKWMIEPVFGQIKEPMGFRRFTRRGMPAARAEWAFVCTAHNLLKLWRAGTPPPA